MERGDPALTRALVEPIRFLSVVDIDAVIDGPQHRRSGRWSGQYVFYFTLLAGVLVLLASISASRLNAFWKAA